MGTHPIFESDFDCLTEMISRLPLSCLRPSLLKQSIRSVNATVATSARGRGSNISKEEIETRRESRKASKEESSAEDPSSTGSPKWDSTPQNIWLSESIPETALLKFKSNPKLDAENVLKQSKIHYTARTCMVCGASGVIFSAINIFIPGVKMVMFGMLPIVIAQNVYQPRAIDSRMQIASGVYFDPTTGITSVILTNTELIGPNKVKEIDDLPPIVVNIPPVLTESGHDAIVKEAKSLERFAHVFDKKETMFDKITFGFVGKLTKSIVTKFVTGIENNQSNPLGKNPWRGAAMLIIDREIPIQPISKKSTNGIAAVVRVDIENALKDDEWSSTDLMQFLKDKYENETSIQKK